MYVIACGWNSKLVSKLESSFQENADDTKTLKVNLNMFFQSSLAFLCSVCIYPLYATFIHYRLNDQSASISCHQPMPIIPNNQTRQAPESI
jgi:hypothetical protein